MKISQMKLLKFSRFVALPRSKRLIPVFIRIHRHVEYEYPWMGDRYTATRFGQILAEADNIEDLLGQLKLIKLIEQNNSSAPEQKSREVLQNF